MQLPDDANFCLKCGKSVSASNPKPAEEKWETCEIVCENYESSMSVWEQTKARAEARNNEKYYGAGVSRRVYKFTVKVFGQSGVSVIKTSRDYYLRDDPRQTASNEINEMVAELAKEGWEATGKGERWYGYRFRRKII